ncbi:cell wall hydrolase [Belnapia sp. T6]|uniref:Cell wall hydrolase n=1 Tax=Belnapia mucosa TaxID=2804532 RepID=A0ABS1VBX7_9PROT|nr:cell wall hydrolase [Belnapia mucosa]MBL6459175.1 cell wall hydrolase [Belnapia mucosa]
MTGAEVLALTLRAEAAGRPVRALEALAALVVNRARLAAEGSAPRARFAPDAGAGWAGLLAAACRAPFLFACWQPGRRPPLAAPDALTEACQRIARRALGGALADPTGGATHWHDGACLPGWAIGQVPVAEIGGLVFYRLAAEAPPCANAKPAAESRARLRA